MGDSKPPASAEPQSRRRNSPESHKLPREFTSKQWRWRIFWLRRSGERTAWALVLVVPALLAMIYLALPESDQTQVDAAIQWVGQSLGATGLRIGVEATLVACTFVSVVLFLVPNYRKYRYLTLPTSIIPPVSVYVDAENILGEGSVPAFVDHLRTHIGDRRADLLFFMEAATEARTGKYKALFRAGFRPVDVPHDPTGTKPMGEAVDREIAMHAFERALLGPPQQEFIIVTSDRDFAPLIYRLVALGHTVQIWSAGYSYTYNQVKRDLRLIPPSLLTPVNIASVLGQQSNSPRPAAPTGAIGAKSRASRRRVRKKRQYVSVQWDAPTITPVSTLSVAGQVSLYEAIAMTLSAGQYCQGQFAGDDTRNIALNRLLATNPLKSSMIRVGYSGASAIDYWRDHLIAIGVFVSRPDAKCPAVGEVNAEEGARRLYAMAAAVASAATRAKTNRPDGLLSMDTILLQLAADDLPSDAQAMLAPLIATKAGRGGTHVRYLTHCARSVGIMRFDDTRADQLIANPRVTADAAVDAE